MPKVLEGTQAHYRFPEVPGGVFYHVTLASGATINEETLRIIGDFFECERDTIFHFDPEGKHKGREIDLEKVLAAQPSASDR